MTIPTPTPAVADVLRIVADAAIDAESDASRLGWDSQVFVQSFIKYLTDPTRLAAQTATPACDHIQYGRYLVRRNGPLRCKNCHAVVPETTPAVSPAPAEKCCPVCHKYIGKCPACHRTKSIPDLAGTSRPNEPESGRTGDDRGFSPKSDDAAKADGATTTGFKSSPASPVPLHTAGQREAHNIRDRVRGMATQPGTPETDADVRNPNNPSSPLATPEGAGELRGDK